VTPEVVDLGTLRPGESAEATITLYNPTDETVVIERIETSCDCVYVDAPRIAISRGGSCKAVVRASADRDGDQEASLRVRIAGYAPDNQTKFQAHAVLKRRAAKAAIATPKPSRQKSG
jgi:hypothetical protein